MNTIFYIMSLYTWATLTTNECRDYLLSLFSLAVPSSLYIIVSLLVTEFSSNETFRCANATFPCNVRFLLPSIFLSSQRRFSQGREFAARTSSMSREYLSREWPSTFRSDGIRVDLRASSHPFSFSPAPLDPRHESLGV